MYTVVDMECGKFLIYFDEVNNNNNSYSIVA